MSCKARRVRNASQMSVHDPVAAIGDKSMAALALPKAYFACDTGLHECRSEGMTSGCEAKRDDFHRQRKPPQRVHPFAVVGAHDHPRGGRRNNLLAQQRAAATLADIERGVDLVGAVDGK